MLGRVVLALILAILLAGLSASCDRKKEVTEKDRQAAMSYYRLAVNYFNQQNVIETLKSLKDAEEFDPENVPVKNLFGLVYLGKSRNKPENEKELELAENVLKEAIRLDPKYSDAYVNLAAVYIEKKQWQKAIDSLRAPSEDLMYPRKDIVYDNLGWCYHMLKNDTKAIESLRLAVTENPKSCHAWYNMGLVYKNSVQYEDAIHALKRAVEQCDRFLSGYYELALVAIKIRKNDIAKPALEKCIELGGEGLEASECRNYLRMLE